MRVRRHRQEPARPDPHGGPHHSARTGEGTMSDRGRLAAMGHETLDILRTGSYQSPSGRTVPLRADLDASIQDTTLYRPDGFGHEAPQKRSEPTRIAVTS